MEEDRKMISMTIVTMEAETYGNVHTTDMKMYI